MPVSVSYKRAKLNDGAALVRAGKQPVPFFNGAYTSTVKKQKMDNELGALIEKVREGECVGRSIKRKIEEEFLPVVHVVDACPLPPNGGVVAGMPRLARPIGRPSRESTAAGLLPDKLPG
jgi:hypothetical protein